ncbi:MAG: hypothetical protein AAF697_01350 [Pseudomonadota bacterium]
MNEKPDSASNYKALGISFVVLGASLAITFGLTLGWVFAPIGLSFAALGLVFFAQEEKSE